MANSAQLKEAQRFAISSGVQISDNGRSNYVTRRFVKSFQSAFCLGEYGSDSGRLAADGDPGPKTLAAMALCSRSGFKLSENFSMAEIGITKGDKRVTLTNPVFKCDRQLVLALQRLRNDRGPIYIISSYRDPVYNKIIGGAALSQHMFGKAVDIDRRKTGEITENVARSAGFSGIGLLSASRPGRDVCHVDVRNSIARWFYTP